jgi:hypothetical protein
MKQCANKGGMTLILIQRKQILLYLQQQTSNTTPLMVKLFLLLLLAAKSVQPMILIILAKEIFFSCWAVLTLAPMVAFTVLGLNTAVIPKFQLISVIQI